MFKSLLCCRGIVYDYDDMDDDTDDIDNEYNEIRKNIKKNIHNDFKKDLPAFNVFYTRETQKIYMYDGENWTCYKIVSGVCLLIEIMKKKYWNKYEQYLVEKIKHGKNEKMNKYYTSYLKKYYFFLVCLYVQPNVLEDDYYMLYLKIRDKLRDGDITNKYRDVINILEHCCNKPSSFVNRKLAQMFQVEKRFAEYLL